MPVTDRREWPNAATLVRQRLNEDAMAVEKLSEGIRHFYADARKLEQFAQSGVVERMAG